MCEVPRLGPFRFISSFEKLRLSTINISKLTPYAKDVFPTEYVYFWPFCLHEMLLPWMKNEKKKKFTVLVQTLLIEAEYFECAVPFYFYAASTIMILVLFDFCIFDRNKTELNWTETKFSVLPHNHVVLKLCIDGLDLYTFGCPPPVTSHS